MRSGGRSAPSASRANVSGRPRPECVARGPARVRPTDGTGKYGGRPIGCRRTDRDFAQHRVRMQNNSGRNDNVRGVLRAPLLGATRRSDSFGSIRARTSGADCRDAEPTRDDTLGKSCPRVRGRCGCGDQGADGASDTRATECLKKVTLHRREISAGNALTGNEHNARGLRQFVLMEAKRFAQKTSGAIAINGSTDGSARDDP